LTYDGTDFVGSQWQAEGRSIQGVIEAAWAKLTQEQQRFGFAGRTDAGVHAQGQVAHVSTSTRHSPETIHRALNALLPDDVAVLHVWEAAPEFHARYSARRRSYRYLIDTSPVRYPLLSRYTLHIEQPLDVAAMQQALHMLTGEHDFAAFACGQQQSSTVRCCYRATCKPLVWFERPLLAIDLVANGFLRHMVRTIVGTLLLVGRHRLTPAAFEKILQSRQRSQAGPTVAPQGLTLMAVGYPLNVISSEMQLLAYEDV
jgi:tRNA pseudouridine38-40 synthase